jgi:hypothetical protein
LLHRQIGGLCAFENLVNVRGGATIQVNIARAVGHKPAGVHKFRHVVYRWKPALYRKLYNLYSMIIEDLTPQHNHSISTFLDCGSECTVNILGS